MENDYYWPLFTLLEKKLLDKNMSLLFHISLRK